MTAIQWTERTWNPIVGCSVVSPGCTNCYAMRMAWRLANNPTTPHYAGTVKMVNGKPVWTGEIGYARYDTLTAPLRRQKPTVYFVNSMGDLFHESIPDEAIDRVVAVMALCPQHKFQSLTKRAARMRAYLSDHGLYQRFLRAADVLRRGHPKLSRVPISDPAIHARHMPHIWWGVSAEDQRRWDERRQHLRDAPAAVRFVSAEPLLSGIDFGDDLDWLDWVIVGGESGPGARPFNIDWARSIVKQCWAASVPVFVKQLGADPYRPGIGEGYFPLRLSDRKGGDPSEWPADLRIREMPRP